jgi:hypothetical protein
MRCLKANGAERVSECFVDSVDRTELQSDSKYDARERHQDDEGHYRGRDEVLFRLPRDAPKCLWVLGREAFLGRRFTVAHRKAQHIEEQATDEDPVAFCKAISDRMDGMPLIAGRGTGDCRTRVLGL